MRESSFTQGRALGLRSPCQQRRRRYLLDPRHLSHPSTAPGRAERLMDCAENGEKRERESPPLKIDPKWYVRHPVVLTPLTTA